MLVFAAVMGVTFLSTVPPTAGLVAKFFGPANMAMLFGIVMLAHQVGGFLGAWLGGNVFEATGSYDWVWYIDIVLAVGAALVNLPIREARPAVARCARRRPERRTAMTTVDPRTRLLLEAPIAPTLLRLAAPNVLVMVAQAAVGLIETYFVGKLGTDALAGMALVFPIVMLMQMTSAGAMGGGIASAIARALGARAPRRCRCAGAARDADRARLRPGLQRWRCCVGGRCALCAHGRRAALRWKRP